VGELGAYDSLPHTLNQKITRFIESKIDDFDALIIEDYGKRGDHIQLLEGLILLAAA